MSVTAFEATDVDHGSVHLVTKVLAKGWQDFLARPTAAIFIIVVYPLAGFLIYRFAFHEDLLPLLFPMVSGFALIGPLTAVGLFNISRSREAAATPDSVSAYTSVSGDIVGPSVKVGLLLFFIYAAWIGAAYLIYGLTMGDYEPASLGALVSEVFSTAAGWALLIVGCGVGAIFAVLALAVGAVSLPAIYDRKLSAGHAVGLSIRTVAAHPRLFLTWGIVVAVGLALGSLPAFLGLLVVLPVFGHATWHLYRATAADPVRPPAF